MNRNVVYHKLLYQTEEGTNLTDVNDTPFFCRSVLQIIDVDHLVENEAVMMGISGRRFHPKAIQLTPTFVTRFCVSDRVHKRLGSCPIMSTYEDDYKKYSYNTFSGFVEFVRNCGLAVEGQPFWFHLEIRRDFK